MKSLTRARKIVQTRTRLVTRLIFVSIFFRVFFSTFCFNESYSLEVTGWNIDKKEAFERRTNTISLPILSDFS